MKYVVSPRLLRYSSSVVFLFSSFAVHATNGMSIEGYGPVAMGMGGASMAYDNDSAAMMNNPATLGLMASDSAYLDLFVGFLGPDVTSSAGSFSSASKADAFYMPAAGWVKKEGKLTYGAGVFAQGGMGTEYDKNSFLALGSGDDVMSQVSVGRLIFPVAYNVDSKWTVGGSLDFVWANMDLKMAVPGAQLGGLITGYSSGWSGLVPALGSQDWGRFDFADDSDFTGAAKGTGFAAKLGAVYKVNNELNVGFAYHSETSLSDLEDNATLSAGPSGGAAIASIYGKIAVKDFQWPSTLGIGISYTPSNKLQIAADIRRINWSNNMESLKMTFTTDAQGELNVELPQHWEDQTVYQAGFSYQLAPAHTLRAGFNYARNPIPDTYLNPLFPAIVEQHYNLGYGYKIGKGKHFDFALSVVPDYTTTTASGVTVSHSQYSWQMVYSQSL